VASESAQSEDIKHATTGLPEEGGSEGGRVKNDDRRQESFVVAFGKKQPSCTPSELGDWGSSNVMRR